MTLTLRHWKLTHGYPYGSCRQIDSERLQFCAEMWRCAGESALFSPKHRPYISVQNKGRERDLNAADIWISGRFLQLAHGYPYGSCRQIDSKRLQFCAEMWRCAGESALFSPKHRPYISAQNKGNERNLTANTD